MKRLLTCKALTALLFIIPLFLLSSQADGAGRPAFVDWASGECEQIDSRWDKITGSYGLDPVSMKGVSYSRPSPERRFSSSRGWSHTGSVHSRSGGTRFLPRTSRKRNGPTRGISSFSNPASMNHGLANQHRRARGSSAYRWNSASHRGNVSRPRLNSFGRISSSRRRSTIGKNLSPFSGRIRRRR